MAALQQNWLTAMPSSGTAQKVTCSSWCQLNVGTSLNQNTINPSTAKQQPRLCTCGLVYKSFIYCIRP